MKIPPTSLLAMVCLFLSSNIFSQGTFNSYKEVDEYVKSLGSLDTLNMGTISHVVTKKFAAPADKARAVFDWIAYNISFDVKKYKTSGNDKMNSDDVLKTRKANANGYATLFQDMCSVAKVRCLTVDGFTKNNVEELGEKPDDMNHSWVVVQLGQSPDSWYYVDPAMGSGYLDEKMTTFTKSYNDAFFFADKLLFNFQHYPTNTAWLIGPGIKNEKDFFSNPILKNYAYELKISNFMPNDGHVKANVNKPVRFSFKVNNTASIDSVSLLIGSQKNKKQQPAYFSFDNNVVSFAHKFEEEDSYPVTIVVNSKPVIEYLVEVAE